MGKLKLRLSLLTQFTLLSLIATIAIALALAYVLREKLVQDALEQVATTAAEQADRIIAPGLRSDDFAGLSPERFAALDSRIHSEVIGQHIVRVKIWNSQDELIYSDEKDLVGKKFPLSDELEEALAGRLAMEVSSLDKAENASESNFRTQRLFEIYVPVRLQSSSVLGAYEIYHDLDAVQPRIDEVTWLVYSRVAVGFIVLYLSLYLLVRRASRELVRRIAENARLFDQVRGSEERYALATRGANDGLWDWNLRTNQIYYSARWKSILGYEEDEIRDSPDEWFDQVHPEDRDRVKAELAAHLEGLTPHFQSEHRLRHKEGTYLWTLCRGLALRDAGGTAYRMAGSMSDITSRKRAEEQLLHDAFHDALTELPNRALFLDRLGRAIERAKRLEYYRFAVLYMDCDRFKSVNDSFGHAMGDRLLAAVAQRLQLCLRSVDTVARLGGDEFVILLEDVHDSQDATQVAERIQSDLALPFSLDGHQIFMSVSIGIVLGHTGYEHAGEVLRDADIAMYRAKALGKARYELFDSVLLDRTLARLELENDMHSAIEHHEFQLHYQPIISLRNNRLIGFEALARWQHPHRGLIAPGEFIPIAEESGLIIPLGNWVLREACRQMREWQSRFSYEPPLTISVNLSGRQFAQADLPEQVARILEETGLDAHSLRVEITESVIMEDAVAGATAVSQLKALGVEVQIDDFGTGYSSLSYLQRFPINTLKIDRSFISAMSGQSNGDGTGSEIAQTIVTLARQLGLKVVAEGVETAEQLARLKALECDYVQGYFIARPLAKEKIEEFIAEFDGGPIPVSEYRTASPVRITPGRS
jgi:diguanylate cyclase (GGDEF)-like protein/PAS domain S-box-containing protein